MKERRNTGYSKMPKFNQFKNRNKLITWYCEAFVGLEINIYMNFSNTEVKLLLFFFCLNGRWRSSSGKCQIENFYYLALSSSAPWCFALVQGFFHKLLTSKLKYNMQNPNWSQPIIVRNIFFLTKNISNFKRELGIEIWVRFIDKCANVCAILSWVQTWVFDPEVSIQVNPKVSR